MYCIPLVYVIHLFGSGLQIKYSYQMPSFAAGNADVDIEMLECSIFAMLVVHDDMEREFAYTKAAERSEKAAREKGWAGHWSV